MNQKNRMTYRFDRNGQSISDEIPNTNKLPEPTAAIEDSFSPINSDANKPAKMNVIPLYPSTEKHAVSEVSPWNSAFQEDIGALEKLIRNTDAKPVSKWSQKSITSKVKREKEKPAFLETAAQQDEIQNIAEESDLQEEHLQELPHMYQEESVYDETRRSKAQYSRMTHKKGTPSWLNVFLSVAAALATGAFFGYLLLSLFTGASLWPSRATDNSLTQPENMNAISGAVNGNTNVDTSNGSEEKGTDDANAAKPDSNTAMASIKGLDQTYYMLQYGVFSNTEGRDAALAQLAQKGLAGAGLSGAADYRVYAGVANDKSSAQTIRALLPELDLYVKEINLVAPKEIPFSGDQSAAQAFFDQTALLVQMLDELTFAQLEQPTMSSLSESAAASWQGQYQKWTENAAAMRIGIVDEKGKAYLDKVSQAINTAAKSLIEYDKKPSRTHLWSTQMGTMEAILTQNEWFETISAL
ncbi:hypothetical protein BK133_15640 [Paenibacillus sp. FSL H8-0548]|uniref:SPOR domain-containing protein n=1 Tax=Paenibacillus sp. FSL H8-0548 TaxID=1920422 RepID=UPI00096C9007|nr:SPOR domain-containing protein [Paenibacillus sp. FSL H8-0548]OMF31662.1 hypothetical protein BK133_15640 [Paenibacillus sp. FSL H8-0548]